MGGCHRVTSINKLLPGDGPSFRDPCGARALLDEIAKCSGLSHHPVFMESKGYDHVTSSARELASSFSITRLRCSLTVRIVIPNSLAISLLSRPETTWFKTSYSRGVNVFNPLKILSTFTESFLITKYSARKIAFFPTAHRPVFTGSRNPNALI